MQTYTGINGNITDILNNYLFSFVERLSTRLGGSSPDPTRQREASAVMADDGCRTPATPLREGIQQ